MIYKKKRSLVEEGSLDVDLSVFITPMLDMSFQLLAFGIMFFQPGMVVEGFVAGKLMPSTEIAIQADTPKKEKKDSIDEPPDVEEKVVVFAKAVAEGQQEGDRGEGELSQILIKVGPAEEETVADSTDTYDAGLAKLLDRMSKIRNGASGEKAVVRLQPDPNLQHEYVVRVWNTCRSSGFESIGFNAPTGLKKPDADP